MVPCNALGLLQERRDIRKPGPDMGGLQSLLLQLGHTRDRLAGAAVADKARKTLLAFVEADKLLPGDVAQL